MILICFRWLFPRITLSLHIMSYLYVLLRNLIVEYLGEKRSSKLYVSLFHNQSRRQWISIRILKWTPECGHKSKERCVVKLCLYVICFCMCVAHCLLWNGPISELHFLSRRSCMFPIEMFCNCMSLWFHIIVLKTNYMCISNINMNNIFLWWHVNHEIRPWLNSLRPSDAYLCQ